MIPKVLYAGYIYSKTLRLHDLIGTLTFTTGELFYG
jgi:hypothetical protein